MAARSAASRTTTKTKGWLFSALGAWVAAVRIRGDGGVVDVVGEEGPGGPLGVHHVEEVGHSGRWYRAGPAPARADWAPPRRPRYLGRCPGPGPVPAGTEWRGSTAEGEGGRRWQTVPHR